MNIDYRGVNIEFLEYTETWRIDQADFPTLKAAKEHIDKVFKEGLKLDDVPVYILPRWSTDQRTFAFATRWEGNSIWVKDPKTGRRSKHLAEQVILATDETARILNEVDVMLRQSREIVEQADAKRDAIPRIKR